MYSGPWRSSIILCRPVAIRDHPTVGPWRSSIVLCRSFAVRDYPLSVHEDQSSSVVIHGRSVAIQYHPMSVREDQSSSFVSLHQGMRLPDKQTRYRQADKQDNKEDHKVSGFGCSEAPSAYPPTTTTSIRLPPCNWRWKLRGGSLLLLRLLWAQTFSLALRVQTILHLPHRAALAAFWLLLFGNHKTQTREHAPPLAIHWEYQVPINIIEENLLLLIHILTLKFRLQWT